MANFVSPGVYIVEKDISDYTPAINPTVVGIVGFSSRGKPNKATLVTSQESLIRNFGRPQESLPGQGLEGALEILETVNQLYYVRAMDTGTASDASALVPMGGCPVVGVSANSFGVDNSLYLKVQVTNNAGTNQFYTEKVYSVPGGTTVGDTGTAATSQDEAMATVVGGSLDGDRVGSYFLAADGTNFSGLGNYIVGNFAGSGATLSLSAYIDPDLTVGASCLMAIDSSGFASGVSGTEYYSQLHADGKEYFVGAPSGAKATAEAAIGETGGGGNETVSGLLFSSLAVPGWSFQAASATDGLGYLTQSLYEGTGYNLSTLPDGSILGNSVTVGPLGFQNVTLNVNDGGVVDESFKVSLQSSGIFVEDVINTGETNLTSDVIKGNLMAGATIFDSNQLANYQTHASAIGSIDIKGAGGPLEGRGLGEAGMTPAAGVAKASVLTPRFVKFVGGTVAMQGGQNGNGGGNTDSEATALIGVTVPARTGMQALDDDLVPITLAAVPGITDQRVQNALITLAETTGDFLTVFGTPLGIGYPQDAIDYSNGKTSLRTSPFNSSYAALYYPQVKVFNPFLGKDIYLDPAVFAIRQMGYTDTVADLWFAPAGFVRGRLTKPIELEVETNRGDRDSLYSGGNIINPISNFAQQGITIFGQKTTQRRPSALDRINVRRLMVYIKRVIEASTRRFVFEPNDKITQERIQTLLVPLFEDIKRRRGITEFRVICDETVNTPERVDRNELWCKVLIKPTKAAEVLIFELNVTSQATNIS